MAQLHDPGRETQYPAEHEHDGGDDPDDRIVVRLDLENLIIEGARQLREWEMSDSSRSAMHITDVRAAHPSPIALGVASGLL